MLCGCFPLAIYFTFGSVYMSVLLSHFIPASLPTPARVLKSFLCVCIFIPVLPLGSSEPFFRGPFIPRSGHQILSSIDHGESWEGSNQSGDMISFVFQSIWW